MKGKVQWLPLYGYICVPILKVITEYACIVKEIYAVVCSFIVNACEDLRGTPL